MAAEVRSSFPGADVELIPSGGGRFEVARDGTLVFSKKALGRHAEAGEVVRLLRSADTSP